jgi:hypothetical protein
MMTVWYGGAALHEAAMIENVVGKDPVRSTGRRQIQAGVIEETIADSEGLFWRYGLMIAELEHCDPASLKNAILDGYCPRDRPSGIVEEQPSLEAAVPDTYITHKVESRGRQARAAPKPDSEPFSGKGRKIGEVQVDFREWLHQIALEIPAPDRDERKCIGVPFEYGIFLNRV